MCELGGTYNNVTVNIAQRGGNEQGTRAGRRRGETKQELLRQSREPLIIQQPHMGTASERAFYVFRVFRDEFPIRRSNQLSCKLAEKGKPGGGFVYTTEITNKTETR